MVNFRGIFFQDRWTVHVLGGGKGKGGIHSEEPLESKYDANSNWGEVWSEWNSEEGGQVTGWTAAPFLAVPWLPRVSIESWSHCLPHSLFLCRVPFF